MWHYVGFAASRVDCLLAHRVVLVLLFLQQTLGIADFPGSLPPPAAVARNGVAALLLAALVMLNFAPRSPSLFGR